MAYHCQVVTSKNEIISLFAGGPRELRQLRQDCRAREVRNHIPILQLASLVGPNNDIPNANSGVGAEALMHVKPVYVFGGCEYRHACFEIRHKGEFAKKFSPGRLPVSTDTIKRFSAYYQTHNVVDTRASEPEMRQLVRSLVHSEFGRQQINSTTRLRRQRRKLRDTDSVAVEVSL